MRLGLMETPVTLYLASGSVGRLYRLYKLVKSTTQKSLRKKVTRHRSRSVAIEYLKIKILTNSFLSEGSLQQDMSVNLMHEACVVYV